MNLVFELENVICTPNADILACRPIANATEFIQFCKKKGHNITIWTTRSNEMSVRTRTLRWLELNQIPYDRLLFDRPRDPVFVDETPSNAQYYKSVGDNSIVDMLFEEWKKNVR